MRCYWGFLHRPAQQCPRFRSNEIPPPKFRTKDAEVLFVLRLRLFYKIRPPWTPTDNSTSAHHRRSQGPLPRRCPAARGGGTRRCTPAPLRDVTILVTSRLWQRGSRGKCGSPIKFSNWRRPLVGSNREPSAIHLSGNVVMSRIAFE